MEAAQTYFIEVLVLTCNHLLFLSHLNLLVVIVSLSVFGACFMPYLLFAVSPPSTLLRSGLTLLKSRQDTLGERLNPLEERSRMKGAKSRR